MNHPIICRFCGHDNRLSNQEKNAAIAKGLRNSSKQIGRPFVLDAREVVALRKQGLSIGKIAEKLKTNRTTICNYLRRAKKAGAK